MENLNQINSSEYNQGEAFIHRLAQFPAMVGKNLIRQASDDSHATLNWNSSEQRLESQLIDDEFQLCVSLPNFSLCWGSNGKVISELQADGETKDHLLVWVKEQVSIAGLDAAKIHYIDHYQVPEHAVDTGQTFVKPSDEILNAWIAHRTNANEMMAVINHEVGMDSDIRVWPHHFDTGTYYAYGDRKAIGAGWAIGDSMSEFPYLYIYPWHADESIDLSHSPSFDAGKWMTDGWIGAILPLSEMIGVADLDGMISDFIKTVVNEFKTKLDLN